MNGPQLSVVQNDPLPPANHVHKATLVCGSCGEILDDVVAPLGNDGKPTPAGWRIIGDLLRRELSTRVLSAGRRGDFEYLGARQVGARLDQVVGPGNWSTDVHVIRADHPVSVLVSLSLYGVTKVDAGYSNNPDADEETDRSYEQEPLKAAISDGLKRAAVHWGLGRWLYKDMQ